MGHGVSPGTWGSLGMPLSFPHWTSSEGRHYVYPPARGYPDTKVEGMSEAWSEPPPEPAERPTRMEAAWLADSRTLPLNVVTRSQAARDLIEALRPALIEAETRGNVWRQAGLEKLDRAIAAVVGGVLLSWESGRPAYRSLHVSELASPAAGGRQLRAVLDGLMALQLVRSVSGKRFAYQWGDGLSSHGVAPRFWPGTTLLALATEKGITPSTVRDHFKVIAAEKPKPVRQPVTRKPIVAPGRRRQASISLPIDFDGDSTARAIRRSVESFNAFASQFQVLGCDPPQWRRAFGPAWSLGGRWTSVASGVCYQNLRAARRLEGISIDQTRVVEIDVRASHLTIIHGLLGLPLPAGGSLYAGLDGVPEDVAKAWVTGTLGKGWPVAKWSAESLRSALKKRVPLNEHDPKVVGRLLAARYPFLGNPAEALRGPAGLDDLGHIAPAKTLLTHRLMAIEANAITAAMETLRDAGLLALPLHDSILIRGSYEREGVAALQDAFRVHAGIVPRLTIDRPMLQNAA